MLDLLKKLGFLITKDSRKEYDEPEAIEEPEDFGHFEYNEPLFIIDTKKKEEKIDDYKRRIREKKDSHI